MLSTTTVPLGTRCLQQIKPRLTVCGVSSQGGLRQRPTSRQVGLVLDGGEVAKRAVGVQRGEAPCHGNSSLSARVGDTDDMRSGEQHDRDWVALRLAANLRTLVGPKTKVDGQHGVEGPPVGMRLRTGLLERMDGHWVLIWALLGVAGILSGWSRPKWSCLRWSCLRWSRPGKSRPRWYRCTAVDAA